jgi:hypothetical protein
MEGADSGLLESYANSVRFDGIDSATLLTALTDGYSLGITDPLVDSIYV